MKLHNVSDIIIESVLPVWDFVYSGYEKDPTPKCLVLGFYEHPETGNRLMAGVNVRLLDINSSLKLVSIINKINDGKSTRERVRIFERLAKSIFDRAYRTYDTSMMEQIKRDYIEGTPDVSSEPKITNKPKIVSKSKTVSKPKTGSEIDVNKQPGEKQEQPTIRPEQLKKQRPDPPDNQEIKKSRRTEPRPKDNPNNTEFDDTRSEPQKLSPKIKRSERGLEKMPDRFEDKVQRSSSDIHDLEDEEYRPI